MKKILIFFSLMLAVSNFSFATEKVIVSGHSARAPFDWQEGDKLVGACIEIISLIFQDLGVEVESKYSGPWARTLKNLEHGKIDIMCGLYITDERKRFAEFTEPFSKDPVTLFVWHDRSFPFQQWSDLEGKIFGDIIGASRGKKFDEWRSEHATTQYVTSHKQNIKKLERGRIDCFVTSYYLGLMQIKKLGYEEKIVPLDTPISIKNLRYGISRKSSAIEYLPQINARITQLREDGTIDFIIKKHLEYSVFPKLKG